MAAVRHMPYTCRTQTRPFNNKVHSPARPRRHAPAARPQVCTYNQLRFVTLSNFVHDVDVPCVGNTSRGPYNLRTGYGNGVNLDNELFALPELAKMYLRVGWRACVLCACA